MTPAVATGSPVQLASEVNDDGEEEINMDQLERIMTTMASVVEGLGSGAPPLNP